MIRIFGKDRIELASDVDVWIVQRYIAHENCYSSHEYVDWEKSYTVFTNEKEAKEYAESIKSANKLLGHNQPRLRYIDVYKQKKNSL